MNQSIEDDFILIIAKVECNKVIRYDTVSVNDIRILLSKSE